MTAGHGNAGRVHGEPLAGFTEQDMVEAEEEPGRQLWLGKIADAGSKMATVILHRDTTLMPEPGQDVVLVAGVPDWRELLIPDQAVHVAQEAMHRVEEQNVLLQQALDQAGTAVGRIAELHEPRVRTHDGWTEKWCAECRTDWPCKTTRALAGELEVGPDEMRG